MTTIRFFPRTVITFAVMLIYFPSLRYSFVYDDLSFIVANPNLRHLEWGVQAFWDPIVSARDWAPIWRPLRTWIWTLGFQISGADPLVFHSISILVHLTAVLAAFEFGKKISGSMETAFWTALVFAVHPVQTEAVSWISSLSDPLCAAFSFACASLFFEGKIILAIIAFCGALLSKESAVFLPPILLIGGFLFRWNRAKFAGVAVLFILSLVYFGLHRSVTGYESTVFIELGRVPTVMTGFLIYLEKVLFPIHLHPRYMLSETAIASWQFACALTIWSGLAATALLLARRSPVIAFAIVWFIICLPWIPALNFLHSLYWIQERFLYLALFGPALILGIALTQMKIYGRRIGVFTILIMLVIFPRENARWHNHRSLWERLMLEEPTDPFVHINLADVFLENRDFEKAVEYLDKQVELHPKNMEAILRASRGYVISGKFSKGMEAAQKVLASHPEKSGAKYWLCAALAGSGDTDAAISYIGEWRKSAASNDEQPFRAESDLLRAKGNLLGAYAAALEATRRAPRLAELEINLAALALQMKNFALTKFHAERAAALDPFDPRAAALIKLAEAAGGKP